jgi:hypothetical protein
MLTVNVNSSLPELVKNVMHRCKVFGRVRHVRVVGSADPDGQCYALVKMATPPAARNVSRAYGDSVYGDTNVIRLYPVAGTGASKPT